MIIPVYITIVVKRLGHIMYKRYKNILYYYYYYKILTDISLISQHHVHKIELSMCEESTEQ